MPRNARQRPAEAEAVRQENIRAALAERFLKIAVAIEDIAKKRFRGGNVDIPVFIRAAGHVPPPLRNIFLQFFEFLRIVFLHQLVAVAPLKAEAIIRVFLEERKIIPQGGGDVFAQRRFEIPVPGGIQVSGGNGVNARLEV